MAVGAHAPVAVKKTKEGRDAQFTRMWVKCQRARGCRAGRHVVRLGRERDGRYTHNRVRRGIRALWKELHPAHEEFHERERERARFAQLGVRGQAQVIAAGAGVTGSEWTAMSTLIRRESGWDPYAVNPTSGACGLPQALPCSKLGGLDLQNQVLWMIRYVRGRYGTFHVALGHSYSRGWY